MPALPPLPAVALPPAPPWPPFPPWALFAENVLTGGALVFLPAVKVMVADAESKIPPPSPVPPLPPTPASPPKAKLPAPPSRRVRRRCCSHRSRPCPQMRSRRSPRGHP